MTLDLPEFQIHLPIVSGPTPIEPAVVEYNHFDMSPMAYELFLMIAHHPEQKRKILVCDPILQAACRQRIADMFNHQYFHHLHPVAMSANQLLRYLHYRLPDGYAKAGNDVESLGGGTITAADQFEGWMESESHRTHIMGGGWRYWMQTHIGLEMLYVDGGVGGKLAGDHDSVWVFLSCVPPPRTGRELTWSPSSGIRY